MQFLNRTLLKKPALFFDATWLNAPFLDKLAAENWLGGTNDLHRYRKLYQM